MSTEAGKTEAEQVVDAQAELLWPRFVSRFVLRSLSRLVQRAWRWWRA